MTTLPNMGLVKWDSINDFFSHDQLAANFQALDEHDHTPGNGVLIPAGGLAALSVETANLQDVSVTEQKLAASAVTDAKLASPSSTMYRTILNVTGGLITDAIAGTYILSGTGNASVRATTSNVVGTASSMVPPFVYFDDADYAVAGKTKKLRLRAQVAANATQPTITFTFGLYPITVAGGADALTMATGTVVTGSTVAIASPAASTITSGATSDLTIPADGAYALGVVTSAGLTNNSAVLLSAQLQIRNV